MATADMMRRIALSLPQVTEEPHFEKTSFRVAKKIFATIAADGNLAMVKLSNIEQDLFCTFNTNVIYPVPNKWGEKGATYINLALIKEDMLEELLKCAFKQIAPPKLGVLVTLV